jgi:hypothetical protein
MERLYPAIIVAIIFLFAIAAHFGNYWLMDRYGILPVKLWGGLAVTVPCGIALLIMYLWGGRK